MQMSQKGGDRPLDQKNKALNIETQIKQVVIIA
jgi:hypothetical protein